MTIGSVVLAAILGKTFLQMMNGLETGLAMAMITAVIFLLECKSEKAKLFCSLCAGLLPALRPEFILFSLIVVYLLFRTTLAETDSTGVKPRATLLLIGAFLLCSLPWIAWYLVEFGTFSPNTAYAKFAFFAEGCEPTSVKLDSIKGLTLTSILEFGAFPLLLLLLPITRAGRLFLFFIVIFFIVYYQNFPGGLLPYYLFYFSRSFTASPAAKHF